MAASDKKVYNVAVLLFTGADILDYSLPLEVFANTSYNNDIENPEPAFKPVTVASTPTIISGRCLTIQPELTIADALAKINEFDILVVPGGNPRLLLSLSTSAGAEMKLINAFNQSPSTPTTTTSEKIIFSICTGALLLGAAGILTGLKATTHHMALDILRGQDKSIEVISSVSSEGTPSRYVDGGVNGQGKRVVTAGGVTCGLDGALYIAELKAGREAAEVTAGILEHNWQKS